MGPRKILAGALLALSAPFLVIGVIGLVLVLLAEDIRGEPVCGGGL